jgi:hypothetical protein
MKKFLLLIALCIMLFEAVQPVFAQTELLSEELLEVQKKESCWGWWAFKFCVKSEYINKTARVGIKVSALPYFYMNIIKNGCADVNPTKFLSGMQYCVKNFVKPTQSNGYKTKFDFNVTAWIGICRWHMPCSKKTSSWFNFSLP